jgi:hypothetical protein
MSLDLSAVTDSLIGLVRKAWPTAPIWSEIGGPDSGPMFTPTFTGLAPDAVRQGAGPQLSFYLYHVETARAIENLFWQPQMLAAAGGSATRFLPLALDLFYLLFAYSETSYAEEHEAMSVALRMFHDNPVVRSAPGAATPWELTLTMEHRSDDELSRLWQATTAPLRMSVVYRASVVFVDPEATPEGARRTESISLLGGGPVSPSSLSAGDTALPALFGSTSRALYTAPGGEAVPYEHSPAVVAPGGTASVVGTALGTSGVSDHLYLLPAGRGAEIDVTAWRVSGASTPARLTFALPEAVGTPPAAAPPPGLYGVRVGAGAAGASGATRTGATPVSVAAAVAPAGGPVLSGLAQYAVTGSGFTSGATEVLVGAIALEETTGVPGPGEVNLGADGTSFAFGPPAGRAGTVLPLRVRVNGIESDPALWVRL